MDLHSSVFYPNRGLSVTGVANVGTVHVAEVDAAASPDGCADSLSDREGQSKLEQKVQMENMSRSQAMFRVHSKIWFSGHPDWNWVTLFRHLRSQKPHETTFGQMCVKLNSFKHTEWSQL